MLSKSSIETYAELCVLAEREPVEAEFLALAFLGIMPEWIKAL